MPLTYCPNCRFDLPDVIECWNCLESVPIDEAAEHEDTDLGGGDFAGGNEEIPYQSELTICRTFNKSGTVCSKCGKPQKKGHYEIACPNRNCRMELPRIANFDPRTVTVTGPSGSGKSHYIVALDYWWAQHLNRFRLVAVPAMGNRIRKAFKSFTSEVLRNKRRLGATLERKMISFSWHVKPTDGSRQGILFTLPDVSGERLMDSDALLANRYYHHTSGIIFLVDGDRIIQADNPSAVASGPERNPADHFEVANAMIIDLERRHQDNLAEVRNIPVAICVNKLDKLKVHDPRWDDIAHSYTPFHDGFFDIQNCAERSELIRNMLYTDPDLSPALGLLEASFDHIMFFIIATIGSDSEVVKLMPVAVEDPFLFHLWHLNYITSSTVVSA